MEELQKMWDEFSKIPFPKIAHSNVIDLVLLDSYIAGWISSVLNAGHLDNKNMEGLEGTVEALRGNFPKIPQDAQGYFKKLLDMSDLILHNRANYIR